jgi:hypothetical protein
LTPVKLQKKAGLAVVVTVVFFADALDVTALENKVKF